MVESGKKHQGQQASTGAKKDNMDQQLLNEKDMEKAGELHLGLKCKDRSPTMPGSGDQR